MKDFVTASKAKETYVVQTVNNGAKVRRVQVNTTTGQSMLNAAMKKWDEKG